MTASELLRRLLERELPADGALMLRRNACDGTRVTLLFLHQRANVRLRFGTPAREIVCNRSRRIAVFAPHAVFCRVHWEANTFGTTLWRLAILQAGDGAEPIQQIIGVQPGVLLLLAVEGGLGCIRYCA